MGKQKPFKLTFAVTYKCNSRCTTCNIWKRKSSKELTVIEIGRFFQKNPFHWVNLTGGEVFLRKDLVDIVQSISLNSNGLDVLSITTNGILTKKIIEDVTNVLEYAKALTITVSIDGPEAVHNKIRGIKSWHFAVETLKQLKELEKSNKNLHVFVGYTISNKNAGMLEKTYQSLITKIPELQLKDFHVNIFHASDLYFKNKPEKLNIANVMKDISIVMKEKKGFSSIMFLERRYMKKIEEYLKTGKNPLPCKAMLASVYMDPKGDVYPCTMINQSLGNIKDFDFSLKNILEQDKAKLVRAEIAKGNCPGCWTACEAYQSIMVNML